MTRIMSIKMSTPLFILMMLISQLVYSQSNSESIVGKWLKTPKEDLIIEVYKSQDSYDGKISWVKDNAAKKPIGFKIMEGLRYDAKKRIWEKGKISDPRSGKTYGARAKIKADGTLELRAYKGMTILGRKKDFIRVK
jgi:uncharacterized protein (DUF2147 family)